MLHGEETAELYDLGIPRLDGDEVLIDKRPNILHVRADERTY